jgi:cytochrome P450
MYATTLHIYTTARSEANFTRAHQYWPERWLIAEGDAPLQPLAVTRTEPTTAASSSSSTESSGTSSTGSTGSGGGSSGGSAGGTSKFNHDASASMPFGRGPAACPAQSLATVQLKVSAVCYESSYLPVSYEL